MSSPAPSPLQTLTPDDLAIARVVARLTTRVRKNGPLILGTLRRQLEQAPRRRQAPRRHRMGDAPGAQRRAPLPRPPALEDHAPL